MVLFHLHLQNNTKIERIENTGKYKSTTSHQEKYHYDENPIK